MKDCFLRHKKLFPKSEMAALLAAVQTKVSAGMGPEDAKISIVEAALSEAQADKQEIVDAVLKIIGKTPAAAAVEIAKSDRDAEVEKERIAAAERQSEREAEVRKAEAEVRRAEVKAEAQRLALEEKAQERRRAAEAELKAIETAAKTRMDNTDPAVLAKTLYANPTINDWMTPEEKARHAELKAELAQGPGPTVTGGEMIRGKAARLWKRAELQDMALNAKSTKVQDAAVAEMERRDAIPLTPKQIAARARLARRAQNRKIIDQNKDSMLDAIAKKGGINIAEREQIMGDKSGNHRVDFVGYVFSENGTGLDDMATSLAQDFYMTPEEMADGGVRALMDKVRQDMDLVIAGKEPKHFSATREALSMEAEMRARQEKAEEDALAEEAAQAAGPAADDLELDVTPEDLGVENLPVTVENLVAVDLLTAAKERLGEETVERLAMQAESDSEFEALVLQLDEEQRNANQRANEEVAKGIQAGAEAPARAEAGQPARQTAEAGATKLVRLPNKAADLVGQMVKLEQPTPSGPHTVSGRVLRELPGNKVEVRLQQGGYATVGVDEVTPWAQLEQQRPPYGDQTQTEEFKRWSNNAPLVRSAAADAHDFKTGESVVVEAFHGTQRPDRVGNAFKKSRATSGPMAFHTSGPALASSYATGKSDTSLSFEDSDYSNWFKYKPKGERTALDVARAWYRLDRDTQNKIAEIAPTLRNSEDGNSVIAEPGNTSGNGSYDQNLSETQRGYDKRGSGNPLRALVEDWLASGILFNEEERFMDVLKMAGFPMKDITYDSPHAVFPFVFKNYITMQSPLVTTDIPQIVTDALNAAAKRDRTREQQGGGAWDKVNRTLRSWVEEYNRAGDNQYVWTSIPDKVTDLLKSLGYDGIIDKSGKGGGPQHPVYIPFHETQIKSAIGNRGTFGDTRNILKQQAPAYGQQDFDLVGETEDEIRAREAEAKAKEKASMNTAQKAEAALKALREKKEIAERSKTDLFELQPTQAVDKKRQAEIDRKAAEDSLAGQNSLFQTSPEYGNENVKVDVDDLTKGVLARMDLHLKEMGYDSRGSDDVRTMLRTRIARDGVITHPDWIKAYEAAVAGAKRTRERTDAKRAERGNATHVDFARMRELGLTEDWREAGYITPAGSLIDLSGKKEGGERGQRSYDHREAGGTLGMQEYMALGHIRIDLNSGSMDISREPTTQQYRQITEFIELKGGEVTVDLDDGLGELGNDYYLKPARSFSREYQENTKPARVIADIRRFFSGQQPNSLGVAEFRQTPAPYNTLWYYSELARSIEASPMKQGTAKAWQDYIKSRVGKGVKPDELEWTGILDWLATQEGKVTKEQVQAFMEQGGVKVTENVFGDGKQPISDVESRAQEIGQLLHDAGWETYTGPVGSADRFVRRGAQREILYANEIPAERTAVFDLMREAVAIEPYDQFAGGTKFSDYQLPGSVPGSYRELVLTLPEKSVTMVYPDPVTTLPDGFELIHDGSQPERHQWGVTPPPGQVHAAPWGAWRYPTREAAIEGTIRRFNERQNMAAADAWRAQSNDGRFASTHFLDAGNYLAHTRVNDRILPDGRKVLFVEEIQSDRAQKGRTEGFADPNKLAFAVKKLTGDQETIGRFATQAEAEAFAVSQPNGLHGYGVWRLPPDTGIAPAPFVTKTDSWTALVIKRLLRFAAEGGYDALSWTRGDQQVERYTSALRKAVDVIEWKKTPEGVQIVGYKGGAREAGTEAYQVAEARNIADAALERNDRLGFDTLIEAREAVFLHSDDWTNRWPVTELADEFAINNYIKAKEGGVNTARPRTKVVDTTEKESALSDAIGKSMADRIRNDPNQTGTIEGEGITVSDTGMSVYYNSIVPKVVNEISKKIGGGKVVETNIGPWAATKRQNHGWTVVDESGKQIAGPFPSEADATRAKDTAIIGKQQMVEITPAMRAKIMGGQALFQPKPTYNEGQLELFYDHAQTRPGTTQEQKDQGILALKALFGRKRVAGQPGGDNAGGGASTLLGSALWKSFRERQGAELIGQEVRTPQDLATLAQILRDPRFETLRFFFVKDGKIVGHTGVTSRLPGSVSFVGQLIKGKTGDQAFTAEIKRLRHMMQRLQADGYYVLHNHPSGLAIPSDADISMTTQFAESLKGFNGHVVVDHDHYGLIGERGATTMHQVESGQKPAPEVAHDALGRVIGGPTDLIAVARDIKATKGYAVLIGQTGSDGRVQAIAEIPEDQLSGTNIERRMKAIVRVRHFGRYSGSVSVFVVSENPHLYDFLIKDGVARDVVSTAGISRAAAGVAPRISRDYRAGQMRAEQKGQSPYDANARPANIDQTETQEFKRWFGDSKVVDAEGKPLVVYHGTNADFTVAKPHSPTAVYRLDGKEIQSADSWDMGADRTGVPEGYSYDALSTAYTLGPEAALKFRTEEAERGGHFGKPDTERTLRDLRRLGNGKLTVTTESRPSGAGMWFTPDPNYSFISRRNVADDSGGKVYPVYLSLKNPVYLNSSAIESAGYSFMVERYKKEGYDGAVFADNPKDLRKTGWSGATQIVAFEPTQIKSAIGNTGAFSPTNPDIRFSRDQGASSIPPGFTINEDNRGKVKTLETYYRQQGRDIIVTPLSRIGSIYGESGGGEGGVPLSERTNGGGKEARTGGVGRDASNGMLRDSLDANVAGRVGNQSGLRGDGSQSAQESANQGTPIGTTGADADLAQKIAGLFGKEVVFVATNVPMEFAGVTFPGYDQKSIFIDVRATRAVHIIVGHELMHHMESDAPAVYAKLQNALSGLLRNHREYAIRNQLQPGGYASKEMIGDLMGDNFNNPQFWSDVAQESQGAFSEIANTVKAWLDRLINMITGKHDFGSKAFVSDLQAARKALAQALAEYGGSRGAKIADEMVGRAKPQFSRETRPSTTIEQAKQAGYRATAQKVVDRIDQALNPLGRLPEQGKYLARRGLAQGTIDKANQSVQDMAAVLGKATEGDTKRVYDYLTTAGAQPGLILDQAIRLEAVRLKEAINRIGDELVEHGLLSAESRETYRDSYLPRLYLKHLLTEGDWKALGAGKKPSDMGYLKKRKDIPEEVRKVILGEVTDPGFLAGVALAKPVRDMALLDWLGDISQNENWVMPGSITDFTSTVTGRVQRATPFWLKQEADRLHRMARHIEAEPAEKAIKEADAMDEAAERAIDEHRAIFGETGELPSGDFQDYKQIPTTPRYGRLRGLHVRVEIYNDLMGMADALPTDPGWFQSVFGFGGIGTKATGVWKGLKVAMNPPSQVRNFISNAIATQLFGGVPLRKVPQRVFEAIHEIRHNGKHYQISKEYGVASSTFATQEVYRMKTELLDLEMKTRGLTPMGKMHRLAALLFNKSGDFYQLSETIFKTAVIIDAMERQGMGKEDAVALAQHALFDYSLIQKSARYARSAPIGIPFLCVAEDTDILTSDGWKTIDQVKVGDIAASFNMQTEVLEWKPILDIYQSEYDAELVHVRDRHLDMLMTPDHRVVTYRKRRVAGKRATNEMRLSLELQQAQDLTVTDHIPTAAPFAHVAQGEPVSDAMVEVIGWFVTEGHLHRKCQQIIISQNEGEKADRIRSALDRAGFIWRESQATRRGNIELQFHIRAEFGAKVRALCGGKQLRMDFVRRLTVPQIRLLIDTMILADGHTGKTDGRRCFIQNAGETLESFQAALTIAGISYSVRPHNGKCFNVLLREATLYCIKRATRKLVPYKGRIWCPMVADNQTWVARRNGKPFITHNTYQMKVLPRLIETALLHPQRFLPWVALFYAFPMMVASMLDVDDDDLDKLKMALPEWLQEKGHALVLPWKDEFGRWQIADMGYYMPWGNWTDLGGDLKKGELGAAISTAGIFGGPLTSIIVAIKTGKDAFTGYDIWNKGDPPGRQLASILNYMWSMSAPPFITERGILSPTGLMGKEYGGKLVQALTGTTNKMGEPRSTMTQAMLYLGGFNLKGVTPEFTRAQNLQKMQREIADVKLALRYKLYDQSLSPERKIEIVQDYTDELVKRAAKITKYMKASEIAPSLRQ